MVGIIEIWWDSVLSWNMVMAGYGLLKKMRRIYVLC